MEKFRKPAIIVIVAVIALIIGNVFFGTNEPKKEVVVDPTIENIDFSTATYEQKQAFIEAYLKNPNQAGIDVETQMDAQIKSNFNYPKTVDYNLGESPLLMHGRVVDADTGVVFLEGTGTVENAFKQEEGFTYSVRLVINDKSISIEKVSVNKI